MTLNILPSKCSNKATAVNKHSDCYRLQSSFTYTCHTGILTGVKLLSFPFYLLTCSLIALDLSCWAGFSLVVSCGVYSLIAAHRLLIANWPLLFLNKGSRVCGLWELQHLSRAVAAPGSGTQAQ